VVFERISQHPITVWHKQPQGVSALYDDQALFAMKRVWRMIEWHHDELLQDAARNAHLGHWEDGAALAAHHDEFEEFSMRNGARILSYIVLVCMLDGIAARFYRKLIDIGNHVFQVAEQPDEQAVSARGVEMGLPLSYRNKLAAHTAYADPRRDDSASQMLNSVFHAQAQGSFSGGDLSTFHIGGTQIMLGSDPDTLFRQQYGLKEQHPLMSQHFTLWEDMILAPLMAYEARCPFEDARLRAVSRDTPATPS